MISQHYNTHNVGEDHDDVRDTVSMFDFLFLKRNVHVIRTA